METKKIFNVIMDCSGSMNHEQSIKFIEKLLEDDKELHLVLVDTEIKGILKIASRDDLKRFEKEFYKGGGTMLQPAIEYVKTFLDEYDTYIFTDGYTDALDFTNINGKVTIFYTGAQAQIQHSNGLLEQLLYI